MSELQRYEMNHKGLPEFDDKGVWVLQEDHCAAVAKLEARVKVLGVENLALRESLDVAEAELARLKTQEPVAYRWEGKSSGNICYDGIKPLGVISQPLYAEPRPAVLPEKVLPYASNDKEELAYARGYNDAVDKALALGCQPQKFVVKLPVTRIYDTCYEPWEVKVYQADEIIEAIKAAGGEVAG